MMDSGRREYTHSPAENAALIDGLSRSGAVISGYQLTLTSGC
jgi:hypothetical protein